MRATLLLLLSFLVLSTIAVAEDEPPAADPSPTEQCLVEAGYRFEPGVVWHGAQWNEVNAAVAFPACEAALAMAPDDPGIQFRLARTLMQMGSCSDGLAIMRQSADAGYAPAEAAYGTTSLQGDCNVEADYAVAFDWLSRGARQGNPIAQNNLGAMYDRGIGTVRDGAEAARLYKLAADQGYVPAMQNLGDSFMQGLDIPRSAEIAKRYYRQAAELGDDTSAARLAKLMLHPDDGDVSRDDLREGIALLEGAVGRGSIEAVIVLGIWHEENGNYERALKLFRSCRYTEYGDCAFNIGRMAELGHGMEANGRLALGYFVEAARVGLVDGMIETARAYINGKVGGHPVTADPAEAEEWYLTAVSRGSTVAMVELGTYYFQTLGDGDRALYLYRMAAEGYGSIEGYAKLAEYYLFKSEFDRAQAYGAIVLQYGDARQVALMENLLEVLERMREQRPDARPESTEPAI